MSDFVAEPVAITADPMTIECSKFLGIITNGDAATVRLDNVSGELIGWTGGTGVVYFGPQYPIDTAPAGQVYVAGVAAGAGVVFVSR